MEDNLLYTPHFNRFDICEAYYCYAVQYHNGQWSEEYAMLGRLINLKFKPSPILEIELEDSLSENGMKIYCNILRKRENIYLTVFYDGYKFCLMED